MFGGDYHTYVGHVHTETLTYTISEWKNVYAIRIQGRMHIDTYDNGKMYINGILFHSDDSSGTFTHEYDVDIYKEQTMSSEKLNFVKTHVDNRSGSSQYCFYNLKTTLYIR